jgi:hypothetical protein
MCFTLTGHSNHHRSFIPTIIHGLSNGYHVPLAFFLLANKHQMSYEDVFRHSVSEAAKLGVTVFPTIVFVDFETAIHNAVKTRWPVCEVKVCLWWHVVSI